MSVISFKIFYIYPQNTISKIRYIDVKVDILASTLSTVPAGNHVYDIELVSGNSVTRLLEGRFIVTPEVTR